jgi:hypothetical protein
MLTYTTINYSDIYSGEKPEIGTILDGINSKIIIVLMSMINSELYPNDTSAETQKRLTEFITKRFPQKEKDHLYQSLKNFHDKSQGNSAIWGKRYILEFMKQIFQDYKYGESVETTPDEELRIFKAYLLICEKLNEKDRKELKNVIDVLSKDDPFFFEKMVWPFVLNQFDTNNKVNPIFQFFKLLALLKYSINDAELFESWKQFIAFNGFEKLRTYLGSVYFLIKISQRYAKDELLKVFSWINANEIPHHLLNLSFDIAEFKSDEKKSIDYKGLKEKPLFKSRENEFVILDIDYLNNKIYNGPLFDMYNQTNMAKNSRFKQFPDFKSHISTHVSENIIFKGIIEKLFLNKHTIVHFDDENINNTPDCYIRNGKKIFLIEFKDYLFPGKLVESYSFEKIKEHIDLKFIQNDKGKNKGIYQIVEQLKILTNDRFEFDKFDPRNVIVYPIIVHTNFMYQMPGVNNYLNREFKAKLNEELPELNIQVGDLTVIDLESIFEFLNQNQIDLKKFEGYLKRYNNILKNRSEQFIKQPHQDNFVRARASFDEICKTIFRPEEKYMSGNAITEILLSTIGANEELLDSF